MKDGEALIKEIEAIDFYGLCYQALMQIPDGKVTTYGDIARALGDVKAARAVGRAMALNPRPVVVPCHRVVGHDGDLVGFGLGLDRKRELLEKEGLRIKGGKVQDFKDRRWSDFRIEPVLLRLREMQSKISSKVVLGSMDGRPGYLLAADVHYQRDKIIENRETGEVTETATSSGVLVDAQTGDIMDTKLLRKEIRMPYIPTYLSFREMAPLYYLMKEMGLPQDVGLLLDGNGILHPLRAGIASHMGALMALPSIGVAKSQLCGEYNEQELREKRVAPVEYDGEVRAYAFLAHGKLKKPVFISPGHKMDLEAALDILSPLFKHRVPEPLRYAHILAKTGQL